MPTPSRARPPRSRVGPDRSDLEGLEERAFSCALSSARSCPEAAEDEGLGGSLVGTPVAREGGPDPRATACAGVKRLPFALAADRKRLARAIGRSRRGASPDRWACGRSGWTHCGG